MINLCSQLGIVSKFGMKQGDLLKHLVLYQSLWWNRRSNMISFLHYFTLRRQLILYQALKELKLKVSTVLFFVLFLYLHFLRHFYPFFSVVCVSHLWFVNLCKCCAWHYFYMTEIYQLISLVWNVFYTYLSLFIDENFAFLLMIQRWWTF